jgi:hypothetical protein
MRRRVACRWLGVLLLGAARAAVAGEGPPPLSGPSLAGPSASPAPSNESAGLPPAGGLNRPMLVIPGVNAPGRVRARGSPLPPLEPAGMSRSDDGPQLFGPTSLGPSSPSPSPAPTLTPSITSPALPPASSPAPRFRSPGQPLRLEADSEPAPTSRPGGRSSPSAVTPGTTPESRPAPAIPQRASSRFGRFLPIPFSSGRGDDAQSAIAGEPSTDPASEAALKRRIERQIHEALGDRVHEVEVRVVGREVTIQAKTTRFWQRRTVRRTLESLPGLAGYRHTVELLD